MPEVNFSDQRLYLIGARGCGKSTVGARLAAKLGWEFAETDALAEKIMGRSIAHAVAEWGWNRFREAETQALILAAGVASGQAARQAPAVISTGGGIVLGRENRELMSKSGLTIYLYASGPELARRLRLNPGGRPSLTGEDPAQEIMRVLEEREALYRACARFIVDAEQSVESVCGRVMEILTRCGAAP